MVRAVIFDVDGTLVDSVDLHARAWQEAFRHFGKEVSYEDVRQQIGKGGDHLMPVFLPKEQLEKQGKQIEEYRRNLFLRKYMPQVRRFPRGRELFERLRADGKKIALASSAKGDELDTYKRIARITDLLDTETSADDVKESKPDPAVFEAALQRLKGIQPGDAVAVGDTPYDAEAAGKSGLRMIGVLSGGFPAEQLTAAGCVELYRDVAELLDKYEQSALKR
jgi:HAD superfamily hydrolase (TIGR01509 family)